MTPGPIRTCALGMGLSVLACVLPVQLHAQDRARTPRAPGPGPTALAAAGGAGALPDRTAGDGPVSPPLFGDARLHAVLSGRGGAGEGRPEFADELVRAGRMLFGSRGVLRWGEVEGSGQYRLRLGLNASSPGPGVRVVLLTR